MGKNILRSKTFWVNAITLAVGAATMLAGNEAIGLNPQVSAILTSIVVPSLNLLLRAVTNEPVHLLPQKKEK